MTDINETAEEAGLDLDDLLVKLFRKVHLEEAAKQQDSKLNCPYCGTNLPYTGMTVGQSFCGEYDADGKPMNKLSYFCTLCEKGFD